MSPSPALSAPRLLQVIRAHRLVDADQLDRVLKSIPEEAIEAESAKRLAEALVAARLLTKLQATLLLQGKSRSLTIAGKYRLIDRLGAGGMGLVYLCEHLKMRRPVAVKVLSNRHAPEAGQLDRFLREAQAVAAMKHPNIVQAYDIDQDHGVHYLVMEYVDGADLDRLVSKVGPLDPRRAAYYIAQAAVGLQYAAERGLVHRDIKPSNLLVDRDGVVKVLDLGLARLAGRDGLTERFDSNAVLGTADYISPEQALNSHDVDTRADIYSLGCTFYFLLAGRAPFKDANVTQKLMMHQVTQPMPIRELRTDVPVAMATVIARMTAKDRADRYQSPAEVVEALAEWTDPPPLPPAESELPRPAFGGASPSDSSLSGRGQVTLTLSKGGPRSGLTGSLSTRRPNAAPTPPGRPGRLRPKWLVCAGAVVLGLVVIVVAAWRPWAGTPPEAGPGDTAKANPPVWTPPLPNRGVASRPTRGFGYLLLEPGTPRPAVVTGEIRQTSTDVLYVNSSDLLRALAGDTGSTTVLIRDATGRGPVRVVPYAVLHSGTPFANALVAVDASGPRALMPADCLTADRLGEARPESHALVRGPVTLKPGLTELASLVMDLSDVSAGSGGSTVRIDSGVFLLAGSPGTQNATLGAGVNPLALDFAGRTGYLTLTSDQDFAVKGRATREHMVRARLTGFGDALVLSGMWGTVLGLDTSENDAPQLVIQGLSLTGSGSADKMFRVSFTNDRELGRPTAPVTLIDASLSFRGDSSVDINRPLHLVAGRTARLAATERAKGPKVTLMWTGKITGAGKLLKAGNAPVVLANGQNDFTGGTEVAAGALSLQGENATPAGSGGLIVNNGATLTGTGRLPGGVIVRPGGNLQPGADGGKVLRVSGLSLQKGKVAGREGDATAVFTARPSGTGDGKLLIYEGSAALDLGGATLKVTPAASFKPTDSTRVYLIVNTKAPSVKGAFQSLEAGARVVTTDGKWTARISYQADARSGVAAGGKDVILYDWAAVK